MNETIAASVHQSRIEDKINTIVEQKKHKSNDSSEEQKHNKSILVDKANEKPQVCVYNENVCRRCN